MAAVIRGQLLFENGFYSRAAFIRWRLRAAFIGERLLFVASCYSRTAFIRGRLLFEVGFYSRATCIGGRHLFEDGFYSSAAFIPGRL